MVVMEGPHTSALSVSCGLILPPNITKIIIKKNLSKSIDIFDQVLKIVQSDYLTQAIDKLGEDTGVENKREYCEATLDC